MKNCNSIAKWLASMAAISFLFSGQAFSKALEVKHPSGSQVKQILDQDFVNLLIWEERLGLTLETITKVASDVTNRQSGEPSTNEGLRHRGQIKASIGACIIRSGVLEHIVVTEEMKSEVEAAIAADITLSDFRFIQNYYATKNGRRFRDFLIEDGKIVSSIWESTISSADYVDDEPPELRQPFPPPNQNDAELKELSELLILSREMQIFKILAQDDHGDVSAMGFVGFLQLAYVYHRDDVKKLGNKYKENLPSFKKFVNSPENSHLVSAMINVGRSHLLKPDMSDISDFVSTITRSGSVDCPASVMP